MEDSRLKVNMYRATRVKVENIAYELDEMMKSFLDDIKHVSKKLRTALPENKREFVEIFCENFVWNGEKLGWDWKKPYFFVAKQPKKSMMLPLWDFIRPLFPDTSQNPQYQPVYA